MMFGSSRGTTASGSRSDRRHSAARQALSLCANADALAREAGQVSSAEEHRLMALLEQRDEIMQDLAEQLAILRYERPTADSALYAATERVVDDADELVAEVCAAVSTTQRVTLDLAARVAARVEEIRMELDSVQRAAHANVGYAASPTTRLVDRVR